MQHVRGCLKYRDRGAPYLSVPSAPPRPLGQGPARSRPRAAAEAGPESGPQRHTRKGGHLCPSPTPGPGPLDGEYGPRLMGSSRIVVPIPRFPPFTDPYSFVFSSRARVYVPALSQRCRQSQFFLCLSPSGTSIPNYQRSRGRPGFSRDAIRFAVWASLAGLHEVMFRGLG